MSRSHPSTRDILRRFRLPVILLLAVNLYGIVGYRLMGWGWIDAAYQTVTTLTTVGFREVHPLGPGGELFTISLIVFGIGVVFTTIGIITELLASGDLNSWLRGTRTDRQIDRLRDHFVICAYGRVGRAAADELREEGLPFVVVDIDPRLEPLLEERELPHLIADPSEDAVLHEVGIARAKGLICAVDSDAINVFITLTARELNPDLVIVARASEPAAAERLLRAGADRVVSPYTLSGRRMAFLSVRPAVVDFVDMVTVAPELRLEEIMVRPGSSLDGRTVGQACAASDGVMIVALKKRDGDLTASPDADTRLDVDDLIVALGPHGALEALLG